MLAPVTALADALAVNAARAPQKGFESASGIVIKEAANTVQLAQNVWYRRYRFYRPYYSYYCRPYYYRPYRPYYRPFYRHYGYRRW